MHRTLISNSYVLPLITGDRAETKKMCIVYTVQTLKCKSFLYINTSINISTIMSYYLVLLLLNYTHLWYFYANLTTVEAILNQCSTGYSMYHIFIKMTACNKLTKLVFHRISMSVLLNTSSWLIHPPLGCPCMRWW